MICGTQCKMKIQDPLLKNKNFKTVTELNQV